MAMGGSVYYDEAKFHMPVKATAPTKAFHQTSPWTNQDFNFFAPGVREGIPTPTAFAQTVHRNNLYDGQQGRALNWDAFSDFVTNPVAQKRAQFWWETLANGLEESQYPGIFQNTGTWNAQPTGKTAIRFIRPFTTRALTNPL